MSARQAADEMGAQRAAPPEPFAKTSVPWPSPLGEAAYHGLIGEIVRAIEPETEADPAAILIQLLAAFGNVIGRRYYYFIEGVKHHGNIFVAMVGRTSKGRKGTSWARARQVFFDVQTALSWRNGRIMGGLSTGEGLIEQVRDPIIKPPKGKENSETKDEPVDTGIEDKRLFIIETEFTRTLRVMLRTDNTLSAIVRSAWDGDDLHVLTRKSPLHATAPHISMAAHTTVEDLRQHLQQTDAANGFANRWLYVCAERVRLLPLGGDRNKLQEKLAPLAHALDRIVADSLPGELEPERPADEEITWADESVREAWRDFYHTEAQERPGMFGAITARGEAQVVRLTLLYALLDGARAMKIEHLRAAIEIWRYSLDSARHIFGDALGDGTADTIIAALRAAGAKGMSRLAIRQLFAGHRASSDIGRALNLLLRHRLATYEHIATGGAPREVWRTAPGR